jgi:BolA protein
MTRTDLIRDKLTAALNPTLVEVEDDSARHAGHMGHPGHGHGETHFNVRIVSPVFAGKSRVDRQRLVYAILDAELKNGVHALALVTKAPGEA